MGTQLIADTVRVAARDGVQLVVDVVRVDDGERRPVLLIRTPYGRIGARTGFDVVSAARAGWVVVTADVRGWGDSAGDPMPAVADAADGADTVAWCAAQPWCNGQVAMTGASYLGFAQWQAASTGTPALRAISPSQAPLGRRQQWFYEGGAFLPGVAVQWAAVMASQGSALSAAQRPVLAELMRDPQSLLARPLAEHPLREMFPGFERWLHPDDTEFWDRFDVSPATHPMDIAGYHIGGWYDCFCEATIRGWRELREHAGSERSRAAQRLVIGHWPHGVLGQSMPEVDYLAGSDWGGSGVGVEQDEWLAAATRGEDVDGGVRVFVMGSNAWWDLPDWPPPARTRSLYPGSGTGGARGIGGDGMLADQPPDAGSDGFVHDPSDPVPSCGGRLLNLWRPLPGPYDQRRVEERSDVLVYTGGPLREPLTIAGLVRFEAVFTTTAVSADVCAKLVDVHPDGRAINVVDGVQRGDFPPGRAKEVTVELGSVAYTFRPGHRIRLEVASSNAPRISPNPSTGAAPFEPTAYVRAEQQLHTGGNRPSRLELPVVTNFRPPAVGSTG